jgi:two-component system, sensor histidine kinase and response regulator
MVSAYARHEVMQKEDVGQPEGFLSKPVGPSLLYHSLLQVLRPDAALSSAHDGRAGLREGDLACLEGARILLVEDNANNREVALDFLAAAKVQVDVAIHGGEAIRMVSENEYDLVLMDIAMPDIDGFAATRQIRALGTRDALPIVAMTAHAMAGDRELSLASGMNDHVTKPIDPELLFKALLRWIAPIRPTRPALAPMMVPDAPAVAPAPPQAVGETDLAPVPGVDWDKALASVDYNRTRLDKRLRGFLKEYRSSPQVVRDALQANEYDPLQGLAHNLKSSAVYVGAPGISALAGTIEHALRAGENDKAAALGPELIAALEGLLDGLARMEAPAPGAGVVAADVARLVRRLEALLQADDAQADDVLQELQGALRGTGQDAHLAAIRKAVDDIEYGEALTALGALARALAIPTAERA